MDNFVPLGWENLGAGAHQRRISFPVGWENLGARFPLPSEELELFLAVREGLDLDQGVAIAQPTRHTGGTLFDHAHQRARRCNELGEPLGGTMTRPTESLLELAGSHSRRFTQGGEDGARVSGAGDRSLRGGLRAEAGGALQGKASVAHRLVSRSAPASRKGRRPIRLVWCTAV